MNVSLDLLEKKQDDYQIMRAAYQQMMETYFNSKVHNKIFKVGT